MEMKKRIILSISMAALLVTVLLNCWPLPARAAEKTGRNAEGTVPPYILDTARQCELLIRTDAGQATAEQVTAGQTLAVYQVGLVDATSLSLSYVLREPFAETGVELVSESNAQRQQTIEQLCEYVQEQQLSPLMTVTLDETGAAELTVPQGVYLICQTEPDAATVQIQSTLVGVPYVSESLDEWIYELEVRLKAVQTAVPEDVPTGDRQNPMLYAALVGAAILLLGLLMFARKRNRN